MGRIRRKDAERESELASDLGRFLHVAICDDAENCPVTLDIEE